jgi:hypothetical protein
MLDAAVLLVIVLIGLVHVAAPFTGDQAMFAVGARAMRHGAVLYRDFWDIKQPGIYTFFLTAGVLGGFNEVSVHLLELVTLLAFAIVIQRTARSFLRPSWLASVMPLFIIGIYYLSARPWELTQVEALVGFPLYASVWFALRAIDVPRGRRSRLVASGFAGALAGLLKIVCLPLAAPAWIVAIVLISRAETRGHRIQALRAAGSAAGWIVVGVAAPLAAVATYFVAYGQWHEVTWTYFSYTPKTISIAPRPVSRLTGALGRFGALWAPVLLLGVIGVVHQVRRSWDRWALAFAGWFLVAIPVLLTQHWWPYQLLMFLVPLGFFAARGAEEIVAAWRLGSRPVPAVIGAVVLLSALPLGRTAERRAHQREQHHFGVTSVHREALQDEAEPQYRIGREFRRFVRVRAHAPGSTAIYVLGNPIDLYLSQRAQAIPTNGWEYEQYDAIVWHRITTGLARARPSVLVVEDFAEFEMAHRSPATRDLIARLYCPAEHVNTETWYLPRAGAVCSGSSASIQPP